MPFRSVDPLELPTGEVYQYLVSSVNPRPIAFVSSVDEAGVHNLAPYSFFNAFSSDPPIVVFSSNRRVRDNSTKDTLHNVQTTGECVINMVSYDIVEQMVLTSVEFDAQIDEFERSGLTPLPSEVVRPSRVAESPVQMECKVDRIITLGESGGAGHLVLCRVVRFHFNEAIFDDKGRIDPHRMDLMGRLGRAFYVRASGVAVHRYYQPSQSLPIGYPQLPATARTSEVLTANDLGRLARLAEVPSPQAIAAIRSEEDVQRALAEPTPLLALHQLARRELTKDQVDFAAAVVWLGEEISVAI